MSNREKERQLFCNRMGILPCDVVLLNDDDESDGKEEFADAYTEKMVGDMDG